jgi:hypothetical protein
MTQEHVLLLFMFPEYDSEYFMPYTSDQLDEAKLDARNFTEMYPGVLYVSVIYVHTDGREDEVFRWNNPLSARLTKLVSSAGDAMSISPMLSASAQPAGDFFRKLSRTFSDTALSLRPPSEDQSASPLPSVSKTYGGRKRLRMLRDRDRRR